MKSSRSVLVCAFTLGGALVSACGGVGSTSDESVARERLGVSLDDASAGSDSASVATVNVKTSLGVLSPIAVGANAAAWDSNLVDRSVPRVLEDAGVQLMRYPGGSTADNYHWLSNQPDDPNVGGTAPEANFDAFMAVADRVDARAMITVNYGSGTAEEAADWVRYANRGWRHYDGPVPTYPGASARGHEYGIRYWEIGNEVYGDGTYGATWEVNHKPHDPSTYANGVVNYATAMKAVDPSIRIGAMLTAPGNWPDGQVNGASPQPWNDTVLSIACESLDFVSIHWYPQGPTGESDANLLASPQNGQSTPVSYTPSIPAMVTSLRATLAQHCGAHAKAVQIMVTETNSVSYNPGKQTTSVVNSLFLADQVMTWLENGVTNVDWWAIHNSPFDGNVDPGLYGNYEFGDYGLLSRGMTTANGVAEPAAGTPFPAYFGLQMLARLDHSAKSLLLGASSSSPLVSVHAVKQTDGTLNVLLINKDSSQARDVTVELNGASPRGVAKVFTYGKDDSAIRSTSKRVHGSSFSIRLAPYSMSTVQLP